MSLGIIKHAWIDTIGEMDNDQKNRLLAYFYSFDWNGLHIPVTGNAVRNGKSFTGKDFKGLAIIAPFAL